MRDFTLYKENSGGCLRPLSPLTIHNGSVHPCSCRSGKMRFKTAYGAERMLLINMSLPKSLPSLSSSRFLVLISSLIKW